MGYKPRTIQTYIPKVTPVAALDLNDIVTRLKRFEALSVIEPLQLSSNAFGTTLGFDPDFFDNVDTWCFVSLKTDFIGGITYGTPLEGFKIIQKQDGSYINSSETVKFYNVTNLYGQAGDVAFLVKFGGKYNDWVLAFVRQIPHRFVNLQEELTSDQSSSEDIHWTDNDEPAISGVAENYFKFSGPANLDAFIARARDDSWRIVQIGNPCP